MYNGVRRIRLMPDSGVNPCGGSVWGVIPGLARFSFVGEVSGTAIYASPFNTGPVGYLGFY